MTLPTKNSNPREWLLAVDDDEPIRTFLKIALGSDTMEVVTAHDAASALQILEQRSSEPLLVLTDVLMPGMDGLSLVRKLSLRLKRSKLVVMSGHLHADSYWPVDLREITFLPKPLRLAELLALVESVRSER